MPNFNDLTGQRFGRLTVVSHRSETRGAQKRIVWGCVCDCGTTVVVFGSNLRSGRTTSCGCRNSEVVAARNQTHGKRRTKLYTIWAGIVARCTRPTDPTYRLYGARGIRMCDEWRNSFEAFAEAMGEPPTDAHSIDRINNDGNYEPGNCRWATRIEQANNKRTNRRIEHSGTYLSIAQWARETGIPAPLIHDRIFKRKWSVHDALTKPPRPIKRQSQKPQ